MPEQLSKVVLVAWLGCCMLSGCSNFTTAGRQQNAYKRYVQKYSHNRTKQQAKFKKVKMPAPPKSEDVATTGESGSPQSVTASTGN